MPIANPLFLPPVDLARPTTLTWGNLHGSGIGLTLSSLIETIKKPIIIITADTPTAIRLEYEIRFFQEGQSSHPLISFPDWETLPYDQFSPHQDIISGRLDALYHLPQLTSGTLICPISTLMHRITPSEFLTGNIFLINIGDTLRIETMRMQLEKAGYRHVTQVREHGEFAVRGAIVDLYPMGSHVPYRIDLFDDEVDSIRTFSTETQRSLEKINKIALLPAKEFPLNDASIELFRKQWRSQFSGNPLNCPLYQDISEGICAPGIEYYLPFFFEKTATLFDYIPQNSVIVSIGSVHQKAEEFWQEIRSRYEQRSHDILRPLLLPDQLFIPVPSLFNMIKSHTHIKILEDEVSEHIHHTQFTTEPPINLTVDHKTTEPLSALELFLSHYEGRVLFCAETTGRREVLLQLFHTIGLYPTLIHSWNEFLQTSTPFGITIAPLDQGLQLKEPNILLIAEAQLFGNRIMQRRLRKSAPETVDNVFKNLSELKIGAPVVHIDHGVGRYQGLQTLEVGEYLAEFLCLTYAEGDKLYVPVTSLHLIGRYSGADEETAPLHKLGTPHWQKAKRKAAEQINDVAAELLELYAKRAAHKGEACVEADGQYAAFSAAFPFEETPDQLKTIQQVIEDMQSTKPMDRLVCGDVGFGKTEVAMRAAFFAVQNNKQVAVLVPTTLLAQQHFQTFQDRFSDWPFNIEVISRFKSGKEQLLILDKLEKGTVDIVIGTHKLLQKNISFKSIGLLIIDEEHRFGVQQKERLKALRANIDILALTATPIPRTLNMSFAGIRDLSIIATPPAKRLSIKTFVHEYQDALIYEAISREILRGGQVYFLHNDVSSIEKMARDLEKLVPEARIGVAHGQMRERELEQVMSDFYHRRFNVIVCTTIIESGIDIPSANTIIINRADKLGLAQLHQLRGRVGRSHHQAYAYLFTPSRKLLSADALKRLDAIASLEDLGVGFMLATHDLEIRGAGELLGEGQSGNMHAIGFSLYMDLLNEAVKTLKSGKEIHLNEISPKTTLIELHIPAFIPENYLGDVSLRLQFYKRIASAKNTNELDDLQVEMIDRFGLLPPMTKQLFAISLLRLRCEKLGILKIEANNNGGKIEFIDKPTLDPMKIITLIQTQPTQFKLESSTTLRFFWEPHENTKRIGLVETILTLLE